MAQLKTFSYIAIDPTGKKIKGQMDAPSKDKVIEHIYDLGLTPLSVDEIIPWFSWQKLKEYEIGGIPLSEKVFLMKQFSVMINAGLPLTSILDILAKQANSRKLRKVLTEAREKVAGGMPLSKAFEEYPDVFDPITIALIRAGEESGHLDLIFRRLSAEYTQKHKLVSRIRSAMIYPIIIIIVIVIVLILIMTFVVPEMKKVFISFGVTLPLITRILIALSDSLIKYGLFYLIGFFLLIFAIRAAIKNPSGKKIWDRIILKLPVAGPLVSKLQIVTFARILALLVASGVPILRALELTKESLSNYWFQAEVEDLINVVKKGGNMASRLLQSEFFPPVVGYMVNVGQKTGKLEEVLKKLVAYYDVEIKEATRSLSAALQPILIFFLGAIVAFIVVAIYLPLISLAQNIG